MKKLFKNSFKSFLGSKLAMILLSLAVFLSIGVFTMLSSTSWAFDSSYNQVINAGMLHDFTVNEKYTIDGKSGLTNTSKAQGNQTLVSPKIDWTKITGSYKQSLKNDKIVKDILIGHGVNDVLMNAQNPTPAQINTDPAVKKMMTDAESALNEYVSDTKSELFINATKAQYGNYFAKDGIKSVESIYINSGTNQYKIVNTKDNEEYVDKLVIFKGNAPKKAMPINEFKKHFIDYLKNDPKFKTAYANNPNKIQISKEYKLVFDDDHGLTASFTDPYAYQAVITDGYAKENNIKPIPQSTLQEFNVEIFKAGINIKAINKIFEDSKYKPYVQMIDKTPYIITGIGTTPDFSFPIINQQNPLPNAKTQAVLFTNSHGYKRIEDGFRGNQRENYLAYKFISGISSEDKAKVMSGILNISKKYMSWGNTLNPVSSAFDTNEKVILAPQRIAFLKKLKQSITTISILTTTLLGVLTGFIILMVIKKQISSKRKILGTLLANGYSKNEIAWSMTSIALIIVLVPATIGYITGHLMQKVFINMFTNYWTLPIYNHSFSWLTLLLVVGIPTIGVIIFSYFASRLALKGDLISILSDSQSKTAGWITAQVLKPLAWIGIKSKITISLFTSNLSKMVLVLITTTIAMVAGGVAFSIMGRFNYAQETSNSKVAYSFKVDMASPTFEGGIMKRINPDQLGMQGDNWTTASVKNYTKYFVEEKQPDINKRIANPGSYFHVPTTNDFVQKDTVHYLKNRLQFKSILNFDISKGLNPWGAALSSMPENQRNIANEKEIEFVKALEQWSIDANLQVNSQAILGISTKEYFDNVIGQKGFLTVAKNNGYEFDPKPLKGSAVWPIYEKFLFAGLKEQIRRYDNKEEYHLPYFISYNNITTDNDDEVYTHLDIDFAAKNLSGHNELVSTTITGINPKTKMVKLDDGLIGKLQKFHYDVTRDNEQVVPVVINTYIQETYKLKPGDIIDMSVKNRADRFHFTNKYKARAMVVGIQESYDGPKMYTTQSIANAKLGWVDPIENKEAFNGVYTNAKNPMIFQNISLYSTSGITPGADIIKPNSDLAKNIATFVKNNYENPRVTGWPSYKNVYSDSPYISTFSSANWASMSRYAFKNILDLSGKLIWMVEVIAIFIAILFVAIIASMIISDNKKFISTMKVLGYRNKEIRNMFFRSLMPAIVLGLLVAIPITVGALFAIKAIIISFGAILVPISMMGWELMLSFFLITIAFAIIYYISMRRLGNEETLEAFKA